MKHVFCEDTSEDCFSYKEYLKSKHWKLKRKTFLESPFHEGGCAKCGRKSKRLHIHHKHYDTLGKENLFDLIGLCYVCHSKHHCKELEPTTIAKSRAIGAEVFSIEEMDRFMTSFN